ncbi:MAG: hypothetical protein IJ506_08675 [Clostridia bacterium]|nr:hypothetical protein [Clostridia bacterium]
MEDWLFRPYNAIIGRDLFFFCGGTGEFDGIVSRVLRALKKKYPDVPMERVLFTPFTYSYPLKDLSPYYDKIYPLETLGTEDAQIELRDKIMIDLASAAVVYVRYNFGRAKKLYDYAKDKVLTLKNISDGEPIEHFSSSVIAGETE